MGGRPAFMVAALQADMVETGTIADIDLHHLDKARRRRAVLQ